MFPVNSNFHLRLFLQKAFPVFCCFVLLAVFSRAAAGSRDSKTLVDQVGRTVRVPENPKRVVAFAPSITEIIFDLGCQDRLKGVTRFSDYPAQARKKPKVGSYVYLDLEKIVSLDPDVCIAIKDGNPRSVIDRLESLGIPVFAVNPRGIDTVMAAVEHIGKLMGAEDRAEGIVNSMKARIERVDSLVAEKDKRPGVFIQIGISPIVSAGSDTFIHELIKRAGGTNLAAGYRSYPRFTKEEVLEMAPEVIIITSMARGGVFEKVKKEWMQWEQIPAASNERIHLVESNLFDRPTPRLVDALERLAKLIHPGLLETRNKRQETRGRKQEIRGRRQETRDKKVESREWK